MKKKITEILKITVVLAMTAVITVTSTGCMGIMKKSVYYDFGNRDVKFSDMKYEHVDTSDFYTYAENALKYSHNPLKVLAMISELNNMSAEMQRFIANYELMDIYSSLDIMSSEYADESLYCTVEYAKMYSTYMETLQQLLNSPMSGIVKSLLGDEKYIEQVKDYVIPDNTFEELIEREEDILQSYDDKTALYSKSIYDLIEKYGDSREYLLIKLGELYKPKNKQFGEMFLELVDLRKKMYGENYDSVADYYYESYERDYSQDDAKEFCGFVKKHLVPIYAELYEQNRSAYDDGIFESYDRYYSEEEAINSIKGNIGNIDPDFENVFNKMIELELYDVSDSERKTNASFTTYITGYDLPFLFSKPSGSVEDYRAIVHEFGHFYEMYKNHDESGNIDVKEIHSQGMELLYAPQLDKVFSHESAANLKTTTWLDILYSTVTGCLYDELQRYAFEEEDLTVGKINKKYRELLLEYKIYDESELNDYYIYSWIDVIHSYIAPFYYISYATSAFCALEIYDIMETESFDNARDKYMEIVGYGSQYGIKELTEKAGIGSPFDEKAVIELADTLKTKLN